MDIVEAFPAKLENELGRVEDLPTLPSVVAAVEEAIRSRESSAEDIAEIIAEDPSITSNILRVANSAYYAGSVGRISSVSAAVARLGYEETRRLCTTVAVIRTFGPMGQHLDHRQFWKHSIVAAIATRVIGSYCTPAPPFGEDEAWVAGLLHDIGALVLDQYFPDLFLEIRQVADEQCRPYAEAELSVLKIDHGQIGGRLLDRWNLPPSVVAAIALHHQPSCAEVETRPLVQAVHLADSICTALGIGDGADGIPAAFCNSAWYDLSLPVNHMPDIIERVTAEASRCDSLISLV